MPKTTARVSRRSTERSPTFDINQPLSDQPWYVKTLVWVGVPTLAFGYLLYFVLGDMSGGMKALRAQMEQHQQDMASLIQHLQEDQSRGWALVSLQQRICLNTSKTEQDKLNCVISMTQNPKTP